MTMKKGKGRGAHKGKAKGGGKVSWPSAAPKKDAPKRVSQGPVPKNPSNKKPSAQAAAALKGGSGRGLSVRVKSARGRPVGSTAWLKRQLNDPYVARAKAEGWRSRAAYKLLEMEEKLHILKPGKRVVDLGAAPGGWTQVAVQKVQADTGKGKVVAIDILDWENVAGATCLTLDFLDDAAPDQLKQALGGKADIVLSDMAAPTTGHNATDHLRIIGLAEVAWEFAAEVLAPGGAFICKVFQGGTEGDLLKLIKARCGTVKHLKPPASRAGSAEVYLVALDFKG